MNQNGAHNPEQQNGVFSSQNPNQISVFEIHKNGWLKRYPAAEKKINPFSKPAKIEPQWVVFCIHDDKDAFLELYKNRRGAASHKPFTILPLSRCIHLSPSLVMQDDLFSFTICLDSTSVKFAAASWEQMNDWLDTIKNKLTDLKILSQKENIYSEEPFQSARTKTQSLPSTSAHTSTDVFQNPLRRLNSSESQDNIRLYQSSLRDPASPLPLIPGITQPLPTPEPTTNTSGGDSDQNQRNEQYASTTIVNSAETTNNVSVIEVNNQSSVFNFENLSIESDASEPVTPQSAPVTEHRVYDSLFESLNTELRVENPSYEDHMPHQRRHSESETTEIPSQTSLDTETRSNQNSNSVDREGPQRQLTLKERQVLKLQKEIAHRGGIRVNLRKRDCLNGIAFVECFGAVWIAGWKQKAHPFLHNTFHIGDHVTSIAGYPVRSLQAALKMIKKQVLQVEIILRRVPLGIVLAIKREYEGQDLGLVREGNTAEIKEVIRGGLASRFGLPLHAQSSEDSNSPCKWALTEINNRPLNLFFKDEEIETRLNAVGKDISILVQPLDLVKALKKQLKSTRNFKDYIVQ